MPKIKKPVKGGYKTYRTEDPEHATWQPRKMERPNASTSQQRAHFPDRQSGDEEAVQYTDDSSDNSIPSDLGVIDVDPRANIIGDTTERDRDLWGQEFAEFIKSASGIGGLWFGRRPIGKGGFGIAGLWEKRDANGRFVDQMVIKQITGTDSGRWESKVPKEVKIMKKMNKTKCSGVVRLLEYKRYLHHKRHRLYLEFCPYGDLKVLIDRYKRFRCYLPEDFLWEVFHYLIEAAAAMKDGPVDHPWMNHQIIHMDIKPDNVFLGRENFDDDGIPFYPTAKLGDFGLAEMIEPTDPKNPKDYWGIGTEPYMAPEQRRVFYVARRRKGSQPWKILSHTDVWAIGATMYELMTLNRVSKVYFRDVEDHYHGINEITTLRKPEYDIDLRDTIRSCLVPKPLNRPTVEALRNTINSRRDLRMEMISQGSTRERPLVPNRGQRLYYLGNEIKLLPPGEWRPRPGEKEPDPMDTEGKYRDPEQTPIVWLEHSDAEIDFEPSGGRPKRTSAERREDERPFAEWNSRSPSDEESDDRGGNGGDGNGDGDDDSGPLSHKRKRGESDSDSSSEELRQHLGSNAKAGAQYQSSGVEPGFDDEISPPKLKRHRSHKRHSFIRSKAPERSSGTGGSDGDDLAEEAAQGIAGEEEDMGGEDELDTLELGGAGEKEEDQEDLEVEESSDALGLDTTQNDPNDETDELAEEPVVEQDDVEEEEDDEYEEESDDAEDVASSSPSPIPPPRKRRNAARRLSASSYNDDGSAAMQQDVDEPSVTPGRRRMRRERVEDLGPMVEGKRGGRL